jgi:hypothetical protein
VWSIFLKASFCFWKNGSSLIFWIILRGFRHDKRSSVTHLPWKMHFYWKKSWVCVYSNDSRWIDSSTMTIDITCRREDDRKNQIIIWNRKILITVYSIIFYSSKGERFEALVQKISLTVACMRKHVLSSSRPSCDTMTPPHVHWCVMIISLLFSSTNCLSNFNFHSLHGRDRRKKVIIIRLSSFASLTGMIFH